ncbi:N-acetylmuramoyl-L-alanine amidase [Roseospira marina]|nr:N-acetylmuramoyl-L-alanine amidase [Roseospira marina]MBB4313766.1 N-acetylmuramoyl-L-alanine amidase [Roseospira marina]MBB5086928.1 N-acetylmuramoyl-L-alanine amidase [Roseospira marina]
MASRSARPPHGLREHRTPGVGARGPALVCALAPVTRREVLGAGAAGALLGPTLSLPALAGNRATGVRFGRHDVKTRVVLDLTEPPAYRLFTLDDPPRLVLDLKDSDWLVPAGALPDATGLIGGLRYGLLEGGVTRIVLDLAQPARVLEAFALSPRDGLDWRLVVDVTETPARAFAATAGHDHAILGGRWGPEAPSGAPVADASAPVPPPDPDPLSSQPSTVMAADGTPVPRPRPDLPTDAAATVVPPVRPEVVPSVNAASETVVAGGVKPAAFIPIPARKPPVPRKPMIALDPGHGGRDPGTISVRGMYEKEITLAMGKELRAVLAGTGRYRVMMTRTRDVSVHLRERVRRARQAGADLFLSIHADAIGNPNVRGLSVYTLSEQASDSEAAALAERENKSDIILGMDFSHESQDVTNILIDLAQRETMNRSVQFANVLLDELPPDVRTLNHSRRFAGFAVLKAPDVPSALLEMGYLSNHTDEKLLRQRAYRSKLAQSVVRSLDRFFRVSQGARLAYSSGD